VANRVRSKSGDFWVQETAAAYTSWLAKGKMPSNLKADMKQFYQNSLLVMKNSQNPTLGSYVASYHPDYGYKFVFPGSLWLEQC